MHWLFSIPSGSTYLLHMFKEKVSINPNLVTLQPLEREEARQAMLGQAALRVIQIDPPVADTILDKLSQLNNSVIDPSQPSSSATCWQAEKVPWFSSGRWNITSRREGWMGSYAAIWIRRFVVSTRSSESPPGSCWQH